MKVVYEFSSIHTKKDDIFLQILFHDRWKYKILWKLRDLEAELENEKDGIILIPTLGSRFTIEIRGFSDDMGNEIERRLLPFCK